MAVLPAAYRSLDRRRLAPPHRSGGAVAPRKLRQRKGGVMTYMASLYERAEGEGYLAVWNKHTKATKIFPLVELDEAERFMILESTGCDIYHGWCVLKHAPDRGRGRSEDALFSPGVMFDADLLSTDPNVHSQTRLPTSHGEVMDWLKEAGFPEPSQVRSSGNGLYLDWLHDGGVFLRTDEDRKAYASAVAKFHAALRSSALSLRGWKFDATHDLARVTRMPGTFNHKTNPPKPVKVLQ